MSQAPYLNQVIVELNAVFNSLCMFPKLKTHPDIFPYFSICLVSYCAKPWIKQTIMIGKMVKYCVADTACMDRGGSLEQL